MVYFIQNTSGGDIKIGTSSDLSARLKTLRQYTRLDLRVLAVIDGGRHEESVVHSRFSALRCEGGEWFSPGEDLLEFIHSEGRQWDPTEPVSLRDILVPRANKTVATKKKVRMKCVSIWMRKEAHRALKIIAVRRESTIQDVIDGLICREASGDESIEFRPRSPALGDAVAS